MFVNIFIMEIKLLLLLLLLLLLYPLYFIIIKLFQVK